jgi:tRNA 2-selenouridine synthase
MPRQPTNEQFENLLGLAWAKLERNKPVFLEDESLNIGRDSIPKTLFEKMQRAPLFLINMPLNDRVERLFEEYAHYEPEVLTRLFRQISRRLGGANTKAAINAIAEGRLRDAIRIALAYYDKAYGFDVKKRTSLAIHSFEISNGDMGSLAVEIINKSAKTNYEHEASRLPGL